MSDKAFRIEGIDTEAGIRRFGGKAEIYKKSLVKFANQYIDTATPDSGDLKSFAHQIKGVSANLGMDELSETAAMSEREPENISKMMDSLKEICMRILSAEAVKANSDIGVGKTETGGETEYRKLISELRDALGACNPKRCEEIIARLGKTEWTGLKPVDSKALKQYIDNYDFDGAMKLILIPIRSVDK